MFNQGVRVDVKVASGSCIGIVALVLGSEHVVLSLLRGAHTEVLS